jgi:copper chaperone CopZ
MNRSRYYIVIGLLATASILIGINGFGANLKQTTLEVSNLSCGSCLTRIDDTLKTYTGYSKLGADLRQGIVVVEHEAALEGQVIAKAITDIGYPAKVVADKELTQRPDLFKNQGAGYGCCGGGGRSSGCSASASTWKRLFNQQAVAPAAE